MDALKPDGAGLVGVFQFDWEILGRLLLAAALGSVVGLERALRDKPAGFRTNILICLGACVFTLSSQLLSGPTVDQTRIAAQIVTGVGFLGAGAIIRDAKGIVGLTTAATIWAVAAVGMAAGFGEAFLALGGTFFIMLVLVVCPAVGDWVEVSRALEEYRLMTPKSEGCLEQLETMVKAANLRMTLSDCFEKDKNIVFLFKALGPKKDHRRFRGEMLSRDDWQLCEV